ncbi:glucan 1,4-alpha-glucosidase [Insulibacter thermoxylanivorax]|uniref:Glucan 1,4-alpha-glucosidase n=1 Tax=Insulibacter thermoxylanivorax TaxID=2749268 RepID=A0A916VEK6_9BACL|nr:glycoside hydrolase family 3 protein [Insulibacter thermoxylanivorax]GFR36724.1 glucan 1,4-alpha-glucosidase [Insulibacter thermoxylanivorax]
MSSQKQTYEYPFQNPDLPLETRVNDLVSRLTRDEKINLMCQYQDEVSRLGIPKYKHGTEAAHGVAWLGEATTFPQPIGLACTWDKDLLHRIGEVIGTEARGFYRKDPAVNGLTIWTPTVDMERDPRWGRTEEAYGEDPQLAGQLAASLVRGMQGDHPFYLRTAATLKHFIGNNNEIKRGECSVSIDPRNMHEYYLKAFEIPFVEGGAQSMMTAYNAVNGVPANLNPDVIGIVKQQWGMNGFVVSDAGDVLGTVDEHQYYETYKEAVAHTIKSGIDSITDDHEKSKQAIRDALEEGLLTENDLDIALRNTFRVRFRLGEFDPEDRNPYAQIQESVILAPEHAEVSYEAACKNAVLLKNSSNLLPLKADKLKKVAVVGPLAGVVYRDWYSGTLPYAVTINSAVAEKMNNNVLYHNGCDVVKLKHVASGRYVRLDEEGKLLVDAASPEQAAELEVTDWGWRSHTMRALQNGKYVTTDDKHLSATADEIYGWFTKEVLILDKDEENNQLKINTWNEHAVRLDEDARVAETQESGFEQADLFEQEILVDGLAEAVEAARSSDAAIVVVGNHPLINGKETMDRPDITLPESQLRLIQEVHKVNSNTVVVIVGSYPFAINWVDEHVPAILYTSHAGQELGNAVADVLFGDYNPAGRLNFTWYRSVDQLPDFMDYDIIKGKRTYQYFDGDVLYPFGHGLSYSEFTYSNLRIEQDRIPADSTVTIHVDVTNNSDVAGDEVVQLYVRADQSRVVRPLKQLLGFERVSIEARETVTVSFTLKAGDLAIWDVTREKYVVENGTYTLMIGASSSDIRLTDKIRIDGETIPPRDLTKVTYAFNYDDYEGVYLDECKEGRSCISGIDTGDWISFHDVDFGEGVASFEVRAASVEGGTIEIRLGDPEGTLIGECPVSATGEEQKWHTFTCSVTGAAGSSHKVYLTFKGNMNLSWFRFIR